MIYYPSCWLILSAADKNIPDNWFIMNFVYCQNNKTCNLYWNTPASANVRIDTLVLLCLKTRECCIFARSAFVEYRLASAFCSTEDGTCFFCLQKTQLQNLSTFFDWTQELISLGNCCKTPPPHLYAGGVIDGKKKISTILRKRKM